MLNTAVQHRLPAEVELVSRLVLLAAPLLNAEVGLQRSGMRGRGLPKWNNSRRLSYREELELVHAVRELRDKDRRSVVGGYPGI